MPTLTLTLPRPHKAQRQILRETKRFHALACGRRWGKTTLGHELAARPALERLPVGWFAPTYKLLAEAWRDIKRVLGPVLATANAQERRMELITGGVIEFWTMEDPDAGRSRKYARAIIDEAGLVPDLAGRWQAAIRPTLADLEGDGWLMGTPKGRNYFWECWLKGQSDAGDWKSWQMPTETNPYIAPEEIAAMRAELPAVVAAQELDAQFVEDPTTVFRLTDLDLATQGAVGEQGPQAGARYVTACDIGRRQDATVINVVDATAQPYQRVYHERMERVPYPIIQQRIEAVARRYGGQLWVESNGVGDPVIENLAVRARPFVTTARSKLQALQALQLLLEQGALKARWTAQERKELVAYTWNDQHLQQDCVMSLAIAADALQGRRTVSGDI